jgi:endo-1,4-beta-xylanase
MANRILLGLQAVLLLAAVPAVSAHSQVQTPQEPATASPLRDAFKGKFLIGTTLDFPQLLGRAPEDTALAQKHFNAFTCGNSMKPDFTQPQEGQFTFEQGDRMVEIAAQCGAVPIGHTLVWHSQTPAWFFAGKQGQPLDRETALFRMRTHIATVVGHFKGKVKQWDVVNEAISDAPNEYLRPSPWQKAIGDDFIAEAFRAAHAADPGALLTYNDYNIEMGYKRGKTLKLLKSLLDQKVPIHAVGIQAHWRLGSVNIPEIEKAIQEYSSLGLRVMFTELDLGVLPTRYQGADVNHQENLTPEQRAAIDPYKAGLPDDVAKKQAEAYRQIFDLFMKYRSKIERVTFWGSHDGESWLNNFPIRGRTDYPLLFNRQRKPKPAYFAVLEAASETHKGE